MKAVVFLVFVLYTTSVNTQNKKYYEVNTVVEKSLWGPETRIYNGMQAKEFQFPYMIFVAVSHGKFRISQCSASLVHRHWVLTAAHCFGIERPCLESIILIGGKVDYREYLQTRSTLPFNILVDEKTFGLEERRPVELHLHPEYNNNTSFFDIALLKLEKPFASPHIRPIPISKEKMRKTMHCTILGWGIAEVDTKTYVLNYIANINAKPCKGQPLISLESGVNKKEGICQGDSGGPLVCENKIWGVASFYTYTDNDDSCENSIEDFYSEIYPSIDWIIKRSSGNPSTVVAFKNIIVLTGFWYFMMNSLYIYNA